MRAKISQGTTRLFVCARALQLFSLLLLVLFDSLLIVFFLQGKPVQLIPNYLFFIFDNHEL